MAITPVDIRNKELPKKWFGGYSKNAVEDFLDEIIQEFELLIRENGHLREQAEYLQGKLEQYRNLEDTINKTLMAAQQSAEDMKVNAQKQSDLIIQEARLQAERIIEGGQVKARKIAEENADLSRAAHTLRSQVRALLQAQLEAIDTLQDPFQQAAASRLSDDPGK